jgi:hypothetical protein
MKLIGVNEVFTLVFRIKKSDEVYTRSVIEDNKYTYEIEQTISCNWIRVKVNTSVRRGATLINLLKHVNIVE